MNLPAGNGRSAVRRISYLAWVMVAAAVAAVAATDAPPGLKTWSASPLATIGEGGGAAAGPAQVALVAPRNGMGSAQLGVEADEAFAGVPASVGPLRSGGGVPLAGGVRVRYEDLGRPFVPLLDTPRPAARVHGIWLTAEVAADAAPGTYTGELSLAFRKPVTVPVTLTVSAWQAPNPHDWRTTVSLLQSPESVAGYYGVPMWSDEHFRYLEKSLALMGRAGNDVLSINGIGRTVFGDDPLIVFRSVDGKLVPDFTYLDRYLALYDKYCGEPQLLSVQVFHYSDTARGTDVEPDLVSINVLRDGALVSTPVWSDAGKEPKLPKDVDEEERKDRTYAGMLAMSDAWRSVFVGVRERVARLGWKSSVMLGTSGDQWPSQRLIKYWSDVAPDAQWRVLTHGCGSPMWGITDLGRRQPNGMVVGYLEIARRLQNYRLSVPGHPVACSSRDDVGSSPVMFRSAPGGLAMVSNYAGICWKGLDYWDYRTATGARRNALNTYIGFGTMVGSIPRAILAPGPDGAISTVQFEMLREGLQETEAMVATRETLLALGPPPVKADVAELMLQDGLSPLGGGGALSLFMYFYEGKVGVIPSVPSYNTSKPNGSGTARLISSGRNGDKYEVAVKFSRDPWMDGGTGTYTVTIKRKGDAYTGTYGGEFNGWECGGEVTGKYVPRAYTIREASAGDPALTKRSADVANGLIAASQGNGDIALVEAAERVYATAAEFERLAARG